MSDRSQADSDGGTPADVRLITGHRFGDIGKTGGIGDAGARKGTDDANDEIADERGTIYGEPDFRFLIF